LQNGRVKLILPNFSILNIVLKIIRSILELIEESYPFRKIVHKLNGLDIIKMVCVCNVILYVGKYLAFLVKLEV